MTSLPRIAALVLAAGSSSRMGPTCNKLVEKVAGRPLVAWAVDAMLETGVDPILVVTGFESSRVRAALRDRPCRFVEHASWPRGMGSSLAFGVRELLAQLPIPAAVFVCVGDLPGIRASDVAKIVAAASAEGDSFDPARIFVPTHRERRGHPVLFGADYFAALSALDGDEGGRAILRDHAASVRLVEVGGDAVLNDVDTPAELRAARSGSKNSTPPGARE